jgi:CheY-like chemotaxis protein
MFQETPIELTGPTVIGQQKEIRALLLDDNNFDRQRIRRLNHKTELGVQLDEVGSIEELDSAVRLASYDLIFIDYRLPIGDGMTALSHILDDPMNRDAGKIMITGDAAVDTAVQAMRGGCHDFLAKESMSVETLREAMLNAMSIASQKLQLQIQSDYQRDIIRQGLVDALKNSEVQGNVMAMVQQQFAQAPPARPQLISAIESSEIDALLAVFADEDEFLFH